MDVARDELAGAGDQRRLILHVVADVRPAVLDHEVAPLHVAERREPFLERLDEMRRRLGRRAKITDPSRPFPAPARARLRRPSATGAARGVERQATWPRGHLFVALCWLTLRH